MWPFTRTLGAEQRPGRRLEAPAPTHAPASKSWPTTQPSADAYEAAARVGFEERVSLIAMRSLQAALADPNSALHGSLRKALIDLLCPERRK